MLSRLVGDLDIQIVFYDRESTLFNICSLNISCQSTSKRWKRNGKHPESGWSFGYQLSPLSQLPLYWAWVILSRVNRSTEVRVGTGVLRRLYFLSFDLRTYGFCLAADRIGHSTLVKLMVFNWMNIGYVRTQCQHDIKNSYARVCVAERLQLLNLAVH